jgi:hypothetical protein
LTISDDESDLTLHNGVRNIINHAPAPGGPTRLPTSHNGPTYDFSGKQNMHTNLASSCDIYEAAPLSQASIPLNDLPRLLAPVHPRSAKLSRRSIGDLPRDFQGDNNSRELGNLVQDKTNPAKRRKTDHGGVLLAETLGTARPASRLRDAQRTSTTAGSGPVLNGKTIITGESRAQASGQPSRISTNGAVQRIRFTEAQAMEDVLRRQVFPYITSTAKRYSNSIRKADRTAIVTKVSSEEHL